MNSGFLVFSLFLVQRLGKRTQAEPCKPTYQQPPRCYCWPVRLLPPGVKLAEGAEVLARDLRVAGDPFLQAIAGAAKPRTYWPKDYVLNHGFHV